MPWTWEDFQKKKEGMSKLQAKKGAKMANSILASCLKSGKDLSTCEGIAIATTLKRLGSKRIVK